MNRTIYTIGVITFGSICYYYYRKESKKVYEKIDAPVKVVSIISETSISPQDETMQLAQVYLNTEDETDSVSEYCRCELEYLICENTGENRGAIDIKSDAVQEVLENRGDDPYFGKMEKWDNFHLVYSRNGSIWWIPLFVVALLYTINIMLLSCLKIL